MIKWTFYFEQGNVVSDIRCEEDDLRIAEWVNDPEGLLYIRGSNYDLYINYDHVKAIVREVVEEQAQNPEETPEITEQAA